jgi:hypothetical protein
LICRTITYSTPVLKKLTRRKLLRPSRLLSAYVGLLLTDSRMSASLMAESDTSPHAGENLVFYI